MARRPSVLVVDDSHDTRVELRELLEDEGYSVITACTGREALAFLRGASPPALALVDLWMPIMDGAELAQWVRADPDLARLPLVLITAQAPAAEVRALVDEFLRKPFGREELLEVVERYAGT
jgi:CheY-like chemotaxis protein